MKYFFRKTTLKFTGLVIVASIIFLPLRVQAVNYGEGSYSTNPYSQDVPNSQGTAGSGTKQPRSQSSLEQNSAEVPKSEAIQSYQNTSTDNNTQQITDPDYKEQKFKKNYLFALIGIICFISAVLLVIFARKRRKNKQKTDISYTAQIYSPEQNRKNDQLP